MWPRRYTTWEFLPTVITMLFVANAAGDFAVVNLLRRKWGGRERFEYRPETGEYVDILDNRIQV